MCDKMKLSEELWQDARSAKTKALAARLRQRATRAVALEAALDRFPIVHSAAEIRAMGHTGDYSCQRCGGDFDIELYVWLCHSCYEQFLQWQLSQARAEAEPQPHP